MLIQVIEVCIPCFYFSFKFQIMVITNATFLQHGEPGATVADIQPVDVVVSHVLKQILSKVCHNILWKVPG